MYAPVTDTLVAHFGTSRACLRDSPARRCSLTTDINGLAQVFFATYLPMAFIVPWMFVRYGLRTTLVLAATLNAAGSSLKYVFTLVPGDTTVLALTYVGQGKNACICAVLTHARCCSAVRPGAGRHYVLPNFVCRVVVRRQRARDRQHHRLRGQPAWNGGALRTVIAAHTDINPDAASTAGQVASVIAPALIDDKRPDNNDIATLSWVCGTSRRLAAHECRCLPSRRWWPGC